MEEVIIEPGRSERNYWLDLWLYRELFNVLAWRDLTVRYKQTIIGLAWLFIRPVLAMIVFTVVFGGIAKLPSEGAAPYSLMVLAGMLPWSFFATSLSDAANSLVANASLITKIYFPRLIVPMSAIIVALVDLLVSFLLLLALMAVYRVVPSWHILLLPVFIILALLTGVGPSLWITALNVRYRDFRYVIPFLVQFGIYISPVGYSSSVVPERWRLLYSLNPMVSVIDAFRWCILGDEVQMYLPGLVIGIGITVFFLWLGLRQFRKMERTFADLI
jgi:lipopolysaccharide transport system permease protein